MNGRFFNSQNPKDLIPLLQTALEDGIISADSVLDTIMATKRQQIRNLRPYAITAPKSDGGRWQTRYRDNDGKYKIIKAQTENELLDKLIPLYLYNKHLENLTFYGLYEEWFAYKKDVTSSPNTIRRHRQHYRKYFEDSVLHTTKAETS